MVPVQFRDVVWFPRGTDGRETPMEFRLAHDGHDPSTGMLNVTVQSPTLRPVSIDVHVSQIGVDFGYKVVEYHH
ncbi:MAG: hypothetical protein QGH34_02320 [Candidatus Woesearchaeota archaeon]|nr:hypothetical protein [Candidatus Woesearchaeota archaeon]